MNRGEPVRTSDSAQCASVLEHTLHDFTLLTEIPIYLKPTIALAFSGWFCDCDRFGCKVTSQILFDVSNAFHTFLLKIKKKYIYIYLKLITF